jgi:DNA polymerase-3 subunit beta
MNLTISQEQLAHALGVVARVAATRSPLPSLGCVLLSAANNLLSLACTNLELGIRYTLPAQVQGEWAVAIPARTLNDLVQTLPGGTMITLELLPLKHTLRLACDTTQAQIKGLDAEEFPPLPRPGDGEPIVIASDVLKQIARRVAFSASEDESRPVLTGIHIKISGTKLIAEAADGFRLARFVTETISASQPVNIILPDKAIIQLAALLKDTDGQVTMTLLPNGRNVVISELGAIRLVSQVLDGQFPDLDQVIPKTAATQATLPASALLRMNQQALVLVREDHRVVRVGLTPTNGAPGKLKISAQSEERGVHEAILDAQVNGPALDAISFNAHLLAECLKVFGPDLITVGVNGATAPCVIRPHENPETYVQVLMPMHLG